MKIIDRNNDYYDYLSHQNGVDDETVFDRRYSELLTKKLLCDKINNGDGCYRIVDGKKIPFPLIPYNRFCFQFEKEREEPFFLIALVAGFNFFVLKWNNLRYEENALVDFSMELLCSRKWYEYKGEPLNLYTVNSKAFAVDKMSAKEWQKANLSNCNFHPLLNLSGELENCPIPILRGAGFASIIPPEDIYCGIDEYLLAAKNDVSAESAGLSDVDKAINHGFDKRTSFRNVK